MFIAISGYKAKMRKNKKSAKNDKNTFLKRPYHGELKYAKIFSKLSKTSMQGKLRFENSL